MIYPAAGAASWSSNASYQSAEWILYNLIDITAKGGNFQVGYGPMPNGKFDPKAIKRLEYVGDWLKVNGEAIYATRRRDGDVWKEGNDIRFTRSKDNKTVYAICLKWPGKQLVLKSVRAAEGYEIRLLGFEKPMQWRQDANGLAIEIPESLQSETARPCRQAYSFKITAGK